MLHAEKRERAWYATSRELRQGRVNIIINYVIFNERGRPLPQTRN